MLEDYNEYDKSTIIKTALSLTASFITSGPVGLARDGLENIAEEALKITIDVYNDLFNYVAWIALRYGYSGRYAERYWYYLGI